MLINISIVKSLDSMKMQFNNFDRTMNTKLSAVKACQSFTLMLIQ